MNNVWKINCYDKIIFSHILIKILGPNEHLSSSINKKSTSFSLIVKSSTINKQTERKLNLVPSYDSDEELDKTKQNSNNNILVRLNFFYF
jgi:hypothetical protein